VPRAPRPPAKTRAPYPRPTTRPHIPTHARVILQHESAIYVCVCVCVCVYIYIYIYIYIYMYIYVYIYIYIYGVVQLRPSS